MSSVGGTPDAATEKALVALLSQPLEQYGVVTTLALDSYALVLALLRPPTQKVCLGSPAGWLHTGLCQSIHVSHPCSVRPE